MAQAIASKPIEDSIAKVDGEVAVGEDLEFQRSWWKFERGVWIFFALLIVLDLAGAFGRGPLAKAERRASDGSVDVKYDRIERTGTPAIMTVLFGAGAIHDGKVKLFVSESLVKQLGAQRVVPQPESTMVGAGGLTYTFPASTLPASVEFALQPPGPTDSKFTLQVVDAAPVSGSIFVVP